MQIHENFLTWIWWRPLWRHFRDISCHSRLFFNQKRAFLNKIQACKGLATYSLVMWPIFFYHHFDGPHHTVSIKTFHSSVLHIFYGPTGGKPGIRCIKQVQWVEILVDTYISFLASPFLTLFPKTSQTIKQFKKYTCLRIYFTKDTAFWEMLHFPR